MKSVAIGTIMPWAGDISKIPPGWVKCDGSSLSAQDFPILFEIIGYKYGGEGDTFNTPSILSKAIADFHPNHQTIPGIGMPNQFKDRIGVDVANITSGTSSNIDLRVIITNQNNFSGSVTGTTINPPAYFDTVSIIPRLLGDHHTPSHGHPIDGGYNSVGAASQWVEECEGNFFTNCAFDCPDDCENLSFYAAEANNISSNRASFVIPESATGNNLGYNLQFPGDRNPQATGQLEASNTPVKNYLLSSDDTRETSNSGSGGTFGYPVSLNHNESKFVGRATGHTHDSLDFLINIGSMRAPNVININNISRGNVSPINQSNVGIATVRVDNIDTPSLSIIHIIRAY